MTNKKQVCKRKASVPPSIHPFFGQEDSGDTTLDLKTLRNRIDALESQHATIEKSLGTLSVQLKDAEAALAVEVLKNEALTAKLAETEIIKAALAAEIEKYKQVSAKLTEKDAAEATRVAQAAKPRTVVSYADIAEMPAPQAPPSSVLGQKRPLTADEVARIQKGHGPQARTDFARLYFDGQRRNKLSLVRATFRHAGVDMRSVFDVGFVAGSITMVLVREDKKKELVRALRGINLIYLEDFDETDAKWMSRVMREKGNPADPKAVKVLAWQRFIARMTAKRGLVKNKQGSVFGYYSRVIREAEASIKSLVSAQSEATLGNLSHGDPSPEGMAIDEPTTESH